MKDYDDETVLLASKNSNDKEHVWTKDPKSRACSLFFTVNNKTIGSVPNQIWSLLYVKHPGLVLH